MKIDVHQVAKLARLELDEDKASLFAAQLGNVLEYMDKLGEVDTSGVEPLYSPSEHPAPMRPDEVGREFDRQDILANAPDTDGQFFIVPKVV